MKTTPNHTELLDVSYGHVAQVLTLRDGRDLVEIHIADPTEGWECGEWYLDGQRIALCDGYNGVEWEDEYEPTEEIEGLVKPYTIDGLLARAIADATEKADEQDTDVRILVRPDYYEGINNPQPHILTGREVDPDDNNNDDEHVFDSYQDAADWIEDDESQTYHLAHNEAGRPEYTIVK